MSTFVKTNLLILFFVATFIDCYKATTQLLKSNSPPRKGEGEILLYSRELPVFLFCRFAATDVPFLLVDVENNAHLSVKSRLNFL